jgi:hypothetical protein
MDCVKISKGNVQIGNAIAQIPVEIPKPNTVRE